jgi:ketosteroid isomerase-like protein
MCHLLVWLSVVALAATGCASSSPPEEAAAMPAVVSAATVAALDAANSAFSDAWVAGDVDALLAAYTDDAVLHPPAGGVLTTPDARKGLWASIVNTERIGHRIEPTVRQTLGPGLVLEMGRWHSSVMTDGQAPWSTGCYSVVWREDVGQWRMKYDAWTAPNDASWACRPR